MRRLIRTLVVIAASAVTFTLLGFSVDRPTFVYTVIAMFVADLVWDTAE